jgi:hypothetical protein
MSEKPGPDYYGDDDSDCPNCGGESFIYMCEQEFACVDPEGGCDLCRRRCDWCNPRKSTKSKEPSP